MKAPAATPETEIMCGKIATCDRGTSAKFFPKKPLWVQLTPTLQSKGVFCDLKLSVGTKESQTISSLTFPKMISLFRLRLASTTKLRLFWKNIHFSFGKFHFSTFLFSAIFQAIFYDYKRGTFWSKVVIFWFGESIFQPLSVSNFHEKSYREDFRGTLAFQINRTNVPLSDFSCFLRQVTHPGPTR